MEAAIALFGEAKMLRNCQLQASWHAVLQELDEKSGAAADSGSRSGNTIVVVPIFGFSSLLFAFSCIVR